MNVSSMELTRKEEERENLTQTLTKSEESDLLQYTEGHRVLGDLLRHG
jgi:hypothetical protein